jgi:hypothetical protein
MSITNTGLACELNLVVVPETALAAKHIALSQDLAKRHSARITLDGIEPRLAFAPHVTLYQVAICLHDMDRVLADLAAIAGRTPLLMLAATQYAYNAQDATIELRYKPTTPLTELQDAVLQAVNPIRGSLLRERDPSGHLLSDLITLPGKAGDNIRRTGFDAVGDPQNGGTFIPHVSLNWFQPGTPLDTGSEELPPITDFDGSFVALGIYLLGPYGTCAQRLASLQLASRSPAAAMATAGGGNEDRQ